MPKALFSYPMMKKIISLFLTIIILLLAYGYWHVSTHGWLHLSIRDVSEKQYNLVKDVRIALRDSEGMLLAEGRSDSKYGVVYLNHPETGYCVEEEARAVFSSDARQAWYDCYEKQATWVVKWIRNVTSVDIEFDGCRLTRVPVSLAESKDDWWLWWVPLPHIGGKPSTYFSIDVPVNRLECQSADLQKKE